MSTFHYIRDWRKTKGLTQEQLSDAIGVTPSNVSRIESGKQGFSQALLGKIARALQVAPADLYRSPDDRSDAHPKLMPAALADSFHTQASPPALSNLMEKRHGLPIYASTQEGKTGMIIYLDQPVEWVKMPAPLENVEGGFGIYVVGDSMEPAYRQGDMILIHPIKPANRDDDVLVIIKSSENQKEALVKTMISQDLTRILLRQYNPPKDSDFMAREIDKIYLIVGKYSRR